MMKRTMLCALLLCIVLIDAFAVAAPQQVFWGAVWFHADDNIGMARSAVGRSCTPWENPIDLCKNTFADMYVLPSLSVAEAAKYDPVLDKTLFNVFPSSFAFVDSSFPLSLSRTLSPNEANYEVVNSTATQILMIQQIRAEFETLGRAMYADVCLYVFPEQVVGNNRGPNDLSGYEVFCSHLRNADIGNDTHLTVDFTFPGKGIPVMPGQTFVCAANAFAPRSGVLYDGVSQTDIETHGNSAIPAGVVAVGPNKILKASNLDYRGFNNLKPEVIGPRPRYACEVTFDYYPQVDITPDQIAIPVRFGTRDLFRKFVTNGPQYGNLVHHTVWDAYPFASPDPTALFLGEPRNAGPSDRRLGIGQSSGGPSYYYEFTLNQVRDLTVNTVCDSSNTTCTVGDLYYNGTKHFMADVEFPLRGAMGLVRSKVGSKFCGKISGGNTYRSVYHLNKVFEYDNFSAWRKVNGSWQWAKDVSAKGTIIQPWSSQRTELKLTSVLGIPNYDSLPVWPLQRFGVNMGSLLATNTSPTGEPWASLDVAHYVYITQAACPVPRVNFGGMYGWYDDGQGVYGNPATSGASCPTGYEASQFFGTATVDNDAFSCDKELFPGEEEQPVFQFGGGYGYAWDGTKTVLLANPITGYKCPAGYTAQKVLGTAYFDYDAYYCYKSGDQPRDYDYGGTWGYRWDFVADSVGVWGNSVTEIQACPAGYNSDVVLDTTNLDFRANFCHK